MSEANKALVKRWFEEVWNKGRIEAIDEMMACESIGHGLPIDGQKPVCGPAAFKPFHKAFRSALSNLRIEIVDSIAEGDRVVTRCVVTGVHSGDLMGTAPTNKNVRFEGVTISRIKDGMIAEGWNFYDFMHLYKEVGVRI